MTGNKLLSRLLRMQGFKVTWFALLEERKTLHIGVKPHKTGCRCPYCGRRGTIIARAECREWDDVVVCGLRSFFLRALRDRVPDSWPRPGTNPMGG
jgi:hypothetical protein